MGKRSSHFHLTKNVHHEAHSEEWIWAHQMRKIDRNEGSSPNVESKAAVEVCEYA